MKTLREYIDIVETLSLSEWAPTPEQTKWLGGANQQDPYIMNRMPGAKPPVTFFTNPEDQALAKRMGFPASEPVAAPAPAVAPAAVATPVAEPTKIEPTPLPAAPAVQAPSAPAATPPKQQQAARPAGPNPVLTLQNKLIGLGAKIKADGIMGPQTQAAMKEYGLDANGNPVKDAKTGQPVTNDKTANAIIQRGGVDPKAITKDMTAAQQVRSDLEAQRANTMTPTGAPTYKRPDGQEVYKTQSGQEVAVGSLTDKRNQRQAEYQAQNQAFLAKQAELKAAKAAAASGQGPKPATPTLTPRSTPAVSANSTTLPDGTPIERSQGNSSPEYMNQFGGQAPNQGGTAPAAGSVPPAPAGPPAARTKWAQQYGGKYDPKTGAPLSESSGYNELDRIVSLVHYR
jgi:hypothetical protein